MKILLFGVSNVGKTTTGKLLAERLGFKFYDLDDEIKKYYGITLEEFVNTGRLRERDHKRGIIIKRIIKEAENIVFAITPITYIENFKGRMMADDILQIELFDTPENIFSRLVFSDENDNIYFDDEYKNRHKDHYLKEIQDDLVWYGNVYSELGIKNRFFMNNELPEKVVDRMVAEYGLSQH